MNQAEKLVRQGERTLLALAATYRKCWEASCRHDGLDPKTVFAHFSPDNPYVSYLGRLFEQYQEVLAALPGLGLCWPADLAALAGPVQIQETFCVRNSACSQPK